MIFKVQWGQKSPKSGKMCLTKMYPGPARVLHRVLARVLHSAGSLQGCRRVLARVPQGACKGAAGRSSI